MDIAVRVSLGVKQKESEKRDEYFDLSRELENLWNMKVTGTRTGRLGNKRTSGHYFNFNIVEIGQNSKKSPKDLLSLDSRGKPSAVAVWKKKQQLLNESNNKPG